MISSYLPEITEMSDRVIVMSNGKITGRLTSKEITEKNIMNKAFQAH